mgnify:CR=1 FL=1
MSKSNIYVIIIVGRRPAALPRRNIKTMIQFLSLGKFHTTSADWTHIARPLNEYELMLVDAGTLYIGDTVNSYAVRQHEYLIMPPTGFQHGTRPSSCSFHWLHFTCDETLPCALQGRITDWDSILLLINGIYHSEHKKNRRLSSLLLQGLLEELQFENDVPIPPTSPVKERIDTIIRFNQTNITKVSELARILGYNEKYLSQLFYRETGLHLKKYLNSIHLEKARELLLNTSLPIGVIGKMYGYSDAHNFSRSIKREFGLSPRTIREQFHQLS